MGVHPNMTEEQAREGITAARTIPLRLRENYWHPRIRARHYGGIDSIDWRVACQLASENSTLKDTKLSSWRCACPIRPKSTKNAQKASNSSPPTVPSPSNVGCGRWLRHPYTAAGTPISDFNKGNIKACPHDRPVCARWRPVPVGRRNRPPGGIRDRFPSRSSATEERIYRRSGLNKRQNQLLLRGSGRIRTAVG